MRHCLAPLCSSTSKFPWNSLVFLRTTYVPLATSSPRRYFACWHSFTRKHISILSKVSSYRSRLHSFSQYTFKHLAESIFHMETIMAVPAFQDTILFRLQCNGMAFLVASSKEAYFRCNSISTLKSLREVLPIYLLATISNSRYFGTKDCRDSESFRKCDLAIH